MNEHTSEVAEKQPLVRKSFIVIVGLVLPALILAGLGLYIIVEVPLRLVAGWALFLKRVIPQVTVDNAGLGLGLLALVGFWIGLHVTGRIGWSRRRDSDTQRAGADESGQIRVWRWRWTNAILICLLLAFTAGTACVGLAHQLVWMSSEKLVDRPWTINRIMSRNSLKTLGMAAHNYHDEHETLPVGGTFNQAGRAMHGWQSYLLPYADLTPEQDLFKSINFEKPWNASENRPVFEHRVDAFEIPGNPPEMIEGLAPSGYAANALLIGGGPAFSIRDITDGTSNTLMFGEVNSNHRPWGDPRNWRDPRLGINKDPDGFSGPFRGGVQFAKADGSTTFISEDVDPEVLKAIATPNSGEQVHTSDY